MSVAEPSPATRTALGRQAPDERGHAEHGGERAGTFGGAHAAHLPVAELGEPRGDPVQQQRAHLAVHLAMHLGQAGYLRRMVTGDTRSSNPVAIAELPD